MKTRTLCLVVLTVYLAAGRSSNAIRSPNRAAWSRPSVFTPKRGLPQPEQYGGFESMPDKAKKSQKQPNILVIWGDDIGIKGA
jgi:hypothetical protein